MRAFKFITLLFVGFAVFGSAGFFGYELFVKPARVERKEKAIEASAPAPTATPDPGIPEFQRLKALQEAGKIAEAQAGLTLWVNNNQRSPLLAEARQRLGSANMTLLFQADGTNAISYTVVKGDSLARIASKHQSNAELIQRANSLPNINLQIGEQLVIPTLKIALEIDRSSKKLTLLNNGLFLKEYTLLAAPSSSKKENLTSKVLDKIASAGNKRVAFGDKNYPHSERCILLTQAPSLVGYARPAPTSVESGTNTPVAASTPTPLPGGFVLSSDDLLELYPLITRNTPVLIH